MQRVALTSLRTTFFRRTPAERAIISNTYSRTYVPSSENQKLERLIQKVERLTQDEKPKKKTARNITIFAAVALIGSYAFYKFNQSRFFDALDARIENAPKKKEIQKVVNDVSKWPFQPSLILEAGVDLAFMDKLFQHRGEFVIIEGPSEFNRPEYIEKFMQNNLSADVKILKLNTMLSCDELNNTFLNCCLKSPMTAYKFIWVEDIDYFQAQINAISCTITRASQQSKFDYFLEQLKHEVKQKQASVLIQSYNGSTVRQHKFFQQNASIFRTYSLGEETLPQSVRKLSQLLQRYNVELSENDVSRLVVNVGGSPVVLSQITQQFLSNQPLQDIIHTIQKPKIQQLERILIESCNTSINNNNNNNNNSSNNSVSNGNKTVTVPEGLILWELMQALVQNFEVTGSLGIPHDVVAYSPTALQYLNDSSRAPEISNYIYYYYHYPSSEVKEPQNAQRYKRTPNKSNSLHAGFIAASSLCTIEVFKQILNNDKLNRAIYQLRKQYPSATVNNILAQK